MMLALLDRRGRTVSVLSGAQAILWLAEFVSLVVMVGTAVVVDPRGQVWPAVFIIVLGVVAMATPDSAAGLLTLLGYGGWWFSVDRSTSWAGVLVAAIAGLVFHLSLAHAAAAPPGAATRLAVLRSLLNDAGMVVFATVIADMMVLILHGMGVRTPSLLIGFALVLMGSVPWIAAVGGDSR